MPVDALINQKDTSPFVVQTCHVASTCEIRAHCTTYCTINRILDSVLSGRVETIYTRRFSGMLLVLLRTSSVVKLFTY